MWEEDFDVKETDKVYFKEWAENAEDCAAEVRDADEGMLNKVKRKCMRCWDEFIIENCHLHCMNYYVEHYESCNTECKNTETLCAAYIMPYGQRERFNKRKI